MSRIMSVLVEVKNKHGWEVPVTFYPEDDEERSLYNFFMGDKQRGLPEDVGLFVSSASAFFEDEIDYASWFDLDELESLLDDYREHVHKNVPPVFQAMNATMAIFERAHIPTRLIYWFTS